MSYLIESTLASAPRVARFETSHKVFRPLPLLRNRHVQTLLGHFLSGPAFKHPSQANMLRLPDGDALVLHDSIPCTWQLGDPIAVLVHGLNGSHASPQVQRLALGLLQNNFRAVRLDLRGSGHSLPLARNFYHGGCSDDLREALAEIHRQSPTSPLVLIGVSLGGNIVLKLAGEVVDYPVPGLQRVGALAPPIDLAACVTLLGHGANRLYEKYFIRDLVRSAEERRRYFPDLPAVQWPSRMTMRTFDDIYTAPRRGFADSADYYKRASSFSLIPRITVPTLIMASADDPVIAVEPFLALQAPAHVRVMIHPNGGHLGFLGKDGVGGFRWAERRMVEWAVAN